MNTTTNTAINTCSCGCVEAHIVYRRKSLDGYTVLLWSDGSVTNGLSTVLSRHRTDRRVADALADDVCLYSFVEIHALYAAACKAAQKNPNLSGRDLFRAATAKV